MSDTTLEKNRIQLHPASELANVVNEAPKWVFENFIERREQVILFGPPKTGKSQLALQIALAAARGEPFLKRKPPKAIKVLYFNFEINRRQFARRLVEMTRGKRLGDTQVSEDFEWPSEFWFYGGTLDERLMVIHESRDDGRLEKKRAELKAQIDAIQPELIIFDTLSYLHGVDENANIEVTRLLEIIRELAGEAAHIIVHHTRKQGADREGRRDYSTDSIRGATAIRGSADLILGLFPANGGAGGGAGFKFEIEARNIPSGESFLYARDYGGFEDRSEDDAENLLNWLVDNKDEPIPRLAEDNDAVVIGADFPIDGPRTISRTIQQVNKKTLVKYLQSLGQFGGGDKIRRLLKDLEEGKEIQFKSTGKDGNTKTLFVPPRSGKNVKN
ncbi:MAG TPA: AAA family ATPase [Chthoniobacterales bacterium]